MTLLVLATAYIAGVWLGGALMRAGLLGCDLPDWLWVVPLALLPLTPLLNGKAVVDDETPLRWPESAGFVRPRRGIPRGLVVATSLCVLTGGLRLASVPQAGCWTPTDLAAWNLPSEAVFDWNSPQVTVIGTISNFPTIEDERQEVVVTVSRLHQYDVGFQLSAIATLGLILFATGITEWLNARWPGLQGGLLTGGAEADASVGALLRGMVVDGGVMTVAATILTLPLVAYHFQRVSVLGVLVNFLQKWY